jgi:hypothetical protein
MTVVPGKISRKKKTAEKSRPSSEALYSRNSQSSQTLDYQFYLSAKKSSHGDQR